MKKILQEFKTFALKGSVIDLAVGIIIGASFNKIVNSLVSDVVMPPIGYLLGRVDFEEFYFNLGPHSYTSLSEAKASGAATINYGLFLNAMISFIITAAAVFFLVKIINKLRKVEERNTNSASNIKVCQFCVSTISKLATRCPNCTSQL